MQENILFATISFITLAILYVIWVKFKEARQLNYLRKEPGQTQVGYDSRAKPIYWETNLKLGGFMANELLTMLIALLSICLSVLGFQ